MSNFVRILGSLFAFVFGIILLPLCVVVGLLFSLYFTYELIALYFTSVSDTFSNKNNNEEDTQNKEEVM